MTKKNPSRARKQAVRPWLYWSDSLLAFAKEEFGRAAVERLNEAMAELLSREERFPPPRAFYVAADTFGFIDDTTGKELARDGIPVWRGWPFSDDEFIDQ